jgi:serine/threonine protein kinase/Tfp pilus assembly protein PilF
MTTEATRALILKAVEEDLLVSDALLDEPPPVAPEGYRLVGALGRGGGGVVHLARDLKLDRPVAIKFLSGAGTTALERFRREARYAARLRDARIVQIYELGEVEGRPYIAMQYLDGGNLATASLDLRGVVRVVRDVADAMRHAHAEGIVHRDIKPENILLDAEGGPHLADFGIAHDLGGAIGATISAEGQIIGTPGLMPPEQARGEIEAVDARSDVYALGATMFFKLAGRYPFEGRTLVDVLHAVIHDEPPLLRALNAEVPRPLEAFVHRCLHKAREARYQTMQEVVTALDSWLEGGEVAGEAAPWFRKLIAAERDMPEPAETIDDPHADPYWTTGMDILRQISGWDADLYRVSGSLERSFARLAAIEQRLDEILAERPDLAWARFFRGVVLARRGRFDEALEEMERSIDRMRNLAAAYFELGQLHLALHLQGQQRARRHLSREGVEHDLLAARSRLEEAAVAFKQARRLRGELPAWHIEYARAVGCLAENDFAGCIASCDRALDSEPDVEQLWKLRGDALRLAGEDAVPSYERALAIRRSDYEALYGMAEAHLDADDVAAARAALDRACAIHPAFAEARILLARTYLHEGRAGGSAEALATGRSLAAAALELDAASYDAVVTLAELELEHGRVGEPECFESAVALLGRASALPGCQNRVHHLMTSAEFELARRAGDRATLERLRGCCVEHEGMMVDNGPWTDLRGRIEDALGV